MKKTLSLLLSLVPMLSLALPASAAETEYPTLEGGVARRSKKQERHRPGHSIRRTLKDGG